MDLRVTGVPLVVAGLLLAGCMGAGEGQDLDVSDSQSGTRSGTAERPGAAAVDPDTEVFTVREEATEITLTVDATGGELEVCVIGPPESDCELHFTTVDGKGNTAMTGPNPGDWTVQLTPAGTGPATVQYSITFRESRASEDGN